jgi:hypothetical protein
MNKTDKKEDFVEFSVRPNRGKNKSGHLVYCFINNKQFAVQPALDKQKVRAVVTDFLLYIDRLGYNSPIAIAARKRHNRKL